ncbi:MAG: ferrous iron transporter B, partial [Myxococcota bacterium]
MGALPGTLTLGLVGSPNSGKTTLFNALTGLRARVGNYPGVTVERREGEVELAGRLTRIVDLPGSYSLDPISPDEEVVIRVLEGEMGNRPEALVVVADSCTLERSLLMVAQVLQREAPTCLVLTMTDELRARGGSLNFEQLEAALGIPVIGVVGHKGIGVEKLRELLSRPESWSRPHMLPPRGAQQRAGWVDSVLAAVLTQRPGMSRISEVIDRVVLHPVGGVILFAAVMVTFFQLIFAFAQPAMDLIDVGVTTAGAAVHANLPPGLLADFIADGLVAGVGSVVIFLPQIVLLFSLLYLLEDIGYMARAAFVVDRAMGRIGLEGRSFVALLSSYACA